MRTVLLMLTLRTSTQPSQAIEPRPGAVIEKDFRVARARGGRVRRTERGGDRM